MFQHDPEFKQGTERARIYYDGGIESAVDVYISAILAMYGHMPEGHAAQAKATMKRAIDKLPDHRVGQRP